MSIDWLRGRATQIFLTLDLHLLEKFYDYTRYSPQVAGRRSQVAGRRSQVAKKIVVTFCAMTTISPFMQGCRGKHGQQGPAGEPGAPGANGATGATGATGSGGGSSGSLAFTCAYTYTTCSPFGSLGNCSVPTSITVTSFPTTSSVLACSSVGSIQSIEPLYLTIVGSGSLSSPTQTVTFNTLGSGLFDNTSPSSLVFFTVSCLDTTTGVYTQSDCTNTVT